MDTHNVTGFFFARRTFRCTAHKESAKATAKGISEMTLPGRKTAQQPSPANSQHKKSHAFSSNQLNVFKSLGEALKDHVLTKGKFSYEDPNTRKVDTRTSACDIWKRQLR